MNVINQIGNQPELSMDAMRQVLQPIEKARGLPNSCYTDTSVNLYERQRVFAEGWACAGFAIDAPNKGDLFPFEFAGLPLLLMHGKDDVIRVFHNVCQHRGRTLVDKPANFKKAVACPYHSWTYGLDGALIGTPHVGGVGEHSCPDFDKDSVGLQPVRSAVWFGLIFVDLSGEAEEIDRYLAPVSERWKEFANVPLVHTGEDCTIRFDLDCNWKLAVENYCEAYHLPWVHPELNRYSPLEKHYSIVQESYSGQGSECYTPNFPAGSPVFPDAPGLSAFWDGGAEYIALYPNVLLGIHRDHFYAVLIQPDGPGKTRERFEIFYYDEAVRGPEFEQARATNKELWQAVFAEDRESVESMQRGRLSPGFDGGKFSPVMDKPTHVFHIWVARALMNGRIREQGDTD